VTNTHRGILYMLTASLLFALTMAFAKILSGSMGSVEVTFWRNSIGLVVILFTAFHTPIRNSGGRPFILIFRGVIGTVALLFFFYTISITSLSNAIIYAKTEPIFTALLAFILLRERLSLTVVSAIVIGFVGVLIMSGASWSMLHTMGILTGFLSALAYTSVRSLKALYDTRTVVLSFMIFGTLIPLAFMGMAHFIIPKGWEFMIQPFTVPTGVEWVWIVAMGSIAALGQVFMTKAYFHSPAGLTSTVSYSVILFATLLGMMLGDIAPTPTILAGGVLIVSSGILLARAKG
jgi:drug/metabolite transporter (DMT)-like permease